MGQLYRVVKANERLPGHDNPVFVVIDGETERRGNFYYNPTEKRTEFFVQTSNPGVDFIIYGDFHELEWLEPIAPIEDKEAKHYRQYTEEQVIALLEWVNKNCYMNGQSLRTYPHGEWGSENILKAYKRTL